MSTAATDRWQAALADPGLSKLRELVSDSRPRPVKLQNYLQAFISANEDAARSANFANQLRDDLDPIVLIAHNKEAMASDDTAIRVLKTLKILSRKYDNRVELGKAIADDVVRVLLEGRQSAVAAEAANVVLNICYEKENVALIIAAGGVAPLVQLLSSSELELQANAAGAIQSICFQTEGRQYVRELGAIQMVLPLLGSESLKVQTRAVGAVHNISSEPEAIRVIRRLGGIAPLVSLLRAPSAAICGSAAGALQNLSRESSARKEIRDLGGVVPLTDLLFGDDVQSQVCAAGAILNLLGPDLGPEDESNSKRNSFKKLLSLALAIGIVNEPLREQYSEMEATASAAALPPNT